MSRSLFEKMVKCGQNTFFFIYNFYKKRNFIFFNSTNFTVLEQAHYHSSLGVITSRCWGKNCKYCSFYCLFLHKKFVALYRCFIHYNLHTVYKEMFGPVLFLPRCCQWTNSNIISLGTQLCRRNCLQVQRANITTRAKITPLVVGIHT